MQRLRGFFGLTDQPLEARHQPSGLNTRFEDGALTFADYIAGSRDMLSHAHSALGTADLVKVVDGNAPFELKPPAAGSAGKQKTYSRGVLLIHGLTDSPYFMRHLAAFFQENGFRVMAILLPGHGTQPGDLLEMRWQEWAKAVAYGVDRLAEEVDEVYLAGYSAGGTLSINHSLRDDRVRALLLFSPALKISPRAAWANVHRLYSWLIPEGKWLEVKPDRDIYKYESFPKNAAAQMHALTEAVGARLQGNGLSIPVFVVASADDATVDSSATLAFIARAQHPSSKLVLYTADAEKFSSDIPAQKLELVNSVVREQKILGSAHTALVLPPEDGHYGRVEEYANCIHYFPDDMEKYTACTAHPERALQGEITEKNLQAGILRRLMYNPNFAGLKVSMKRFIDGLP